MNEIKIAPKQKVRFIEEDGTVHEATRPTFGQVYEFEKAMDQARKTNDGLVSLGAARDLMLGCGLSEKFIMSLEDDSLTLVATSLVAKKKAVTTSN